TRSAENRYAAAAKDLAQDFARAQERPHLQPLGEAQERQVCAPGRPKPLQRLAPGGRWDGDDTEGRSAEGPFDVGRQCDRFGNRHAGKQSDVLPVLAQDACILFTGAPQGDAMLRILGQEEGNGGSPSAVTQNGKLDWHGKVSGLCRRKKRAWKVPKR